MEGSGSGTAWKGGTEFSGSEKFTDLPPEVLEQIFRYLDGGTVLALRTLSNRVQILVDEALWGKNGQQFWVNRLCSMPNTPPALLLKALGSFQSVRNTDIINDQLVHGLQQRLTNKWRETFVAFSDFREMCRMHVVVKRLDQVANFIRDEFKSESGSGTVSMSPQRRMSTNGSTLFHVRSPSTRTHQVNLCIFENMDTYSPWRIQLVEGKEKIRTVQTVNLPTEINPADFTDPLLIKIQTICVIATQQHIILTPSCRGNFTRIPLCLDKTYRHYPYLPTENRFGIWGEFLGVWHDPGTIQIYKMYMDRRSGDVSVEVINTIKYLLGLHSFWFAAAASPNSYISVLSDGLKNAFKEFPNPGNPVFSLMSPFLENFTVGEAENLTQRLHMFRPRINYFHHFTDQLATAVMRSQAAFSHRKSEQNVVVFFNHTWIAVLHKIEVWIYEDLRQTLLSKDESLLSLEFQTENFIILGTEKNIYMCLFKCVPAQEQSLACRPSTTVAVRGSFDFEVLRKIPLDTVMPDPNFRLLHCHFDMDLGRPYIFASFDLPKGKRTESSFQIMRLEFGSDEEELDPAETRPLRNNEEGQGRT